MNEPLAVACSTASDLVRFALATKAESVDDEFAERVMSPMTRRRQRIVLPVAVERRAHQHGRSRAESG